MKKITILLFLFAFVDLAIAQVKPDAVLAGAGNRKITVKEFIRRFEFIPMVKKKGLDREKQKENFLYSLMAEKLWALAAEDAGYDTTAIMRETFQSIKRMYIRDAIYQREIKNKVRISEKEKRKAYDRSNVVLKVRFIYSPNEKEIKHIYNELKAGADFDSLLATRREYKYEKSYKDFTYGSADEKLEDALFSLKEGKFTSPLKLAKGWFIFKLYYSEKKKFASEKERRKNLEQARSLLIRRAESKLTDKFFKKYFKDKKVSTDGKIFWSISNALIKILADKRKEEKIPEGEKIALESKDYYRFQKLLGDTLKMEFIHFKKNPISTDEFLHDFIFEGFYTTSLNPNEIRAKLNARVKRFITFELLARMGEEKGYENLPEVKEALDSWRDYYLSTLLRGDFLNRIKVSDDEAKAYYEKINQGALPTKEVNIVEVLTDSLSVVNKVLKALAQGADLHDLAMEYTKRVWTKKNHGELGFFPVSLYGPIGRKAATMKVGEIAGPIETPDGYSIFQLLAVRKINSPLSGEFKDVKAEIVRRIKGEKARKMFIKQTVKFARRYGIELHENLLPKIKVQNFNMLVYKYFGFGGRMLAFPLTPQFSEWMVYYKGTEGILP